MRPTDAWQLINGIDKQPIGEKQEQGAGSIDGNFFIDPGLWDDLPRQISAAKAERHIDIKDPAPADAIDQETAKRRTDQKTDVKGCRGQPERTTAFFWR